MIDFYHGSILKLEVDAIVNPAHPSLRAGGGLCGIIHNRAGKNLETYCRMLGEHEYGDVVITPAFNLPHCKNVIHACAPYWVDGNCMEETILEYLYTQIIEKAAQEKITSIAIPAVSTGINGFPLKKATRIALKTCISMLEQYPMKLTFANNEIKKHIGYQEIHSTLKLEIGGI